MEQTDSRPKIEIVRVPSIERGSFRPLDGVQLRAAYSHVRIGTYCPEPELESELVASPRKICDVKPPIEQSRKFKKNLGPVSRLLRRRHHVTSLATKSCDNIYSVNKSNSFFEWKHGHSCHDQGLHVRQSNSLDWRVGRSIERNSNNFDCRKASRSAEQLSRSGTLQTPSTKSKIVSLLRRLSPRLPRPGSKGSLPSSPSICPWVQVEYSVGSETNDGSKRDELLVQEIDYSFQRELQLSEMRKRAMKVSGSKQELMNDGTLITKEKKSPRLSPQPNVQIQEKQDTNPSLRAVHEERGSSEEASGSRRAGGAASSSITVAGDSARRELADLTSLATPAAGTGGEAESAPRTSRRSRPHSLAVQPLHYHRLDPERQVQLVEPRNEEEPTGKRSTAETLACNVVASATDNKHPNMTSQESIGSCSLDVERSASDRSDVNAGSLSEKTLHSLNLSCNGDSSTTTTPAAAAAQDSSKQLTESTVDSSKSKPNESEAATPVSNGHRSGRESADCEDTRLTEQQQQQQQQQLTASTKKPSYLGLACSISGYSGITRYDSKLREGFRSRDSSPGARLIIRDTSPAGFRSNETLNVPSHSPKSQSISPLAMEQRQHNGFANGVRDKCKIENYLDSCKGYSEVDRGVPTTFDTDPLCPIRVSSANKRNSPVGMRIASYNQHNKSFSSSISASSPKITHVNVSHTSYNETSIQNGSADAENCTLNSSTNSEKSFIQQRVERLYGPGALAQGFFFKRSSAHRLDISDTSNKSTNNNNTSVDYTNEESLKSLPVLRHLRPEFRAQLPVVSPRRPTDGSEQIIKPLKRISLSPGNNDAKETKASPVKQENNTTIDKKMTASVTSLTDQQPAAPKVVLPVLEPSTSLTNIPKQGVEAPKKVQEKDGHYFMSLLNKERDRLILLAEKVESELASSGASDLPEEAAGKLRSAAGKARLLASQKMKQFEGLCQKNINQVPGEEFPTTSEDLAGFWDMVMLQVVQVNDLFEQIERSRNSQWEEVVPEQKSTPATPHNGSTIKRRQTPASKVKSSANAEAARKAREAREQTRRQLIEEKRRAMRSNAKKSENSVEIFVPET